VDPHTAAGRGATRCPALRVVAPQLGNWQVGDELSQFSGGVGGECGLQPVLVFVHRQIALRERQAELVCGPLPVAVARADRLCGRGCHIASPNLDNV